MAIRSYLLVTICCCLSYAAQARGAEVEVNIVFGGLMAFVNGPTPGVAWALLPDLDDQKQRTLLAGARNRKADDYLPHYSAIRIFHAKEIKLGDEVIKNGAPIPIAGLEVALKNQNIELFPDRINFDMLADLKIIETHRSNAAPSSRIPEDAHKVNMSYIDDLVGSDSNPHLNARIMLAGGAIIARPVACKKTDKDIPLRVQYLFNTDDAEPCASTAASTQLAEIVTWKFRHDGALSFWLKKGADNWQTLLLQPYCPGDVCVPLQIEIVNSIDGQEPKEVPTLESMACDDHAHFRTFESYYWFTMKPPFYWYRRFAPPVPYYSPCQASTFTAGGTRCPMIELNP